MKDFALIGAAGYIAPQHMKAIKETGNTLVAALDKHDSVGIVDQYFPDTDFFVEFEIFDRHIDLLKRKGKKVDYISITSPNYLHDSHIRFALRSGAHTICEKPLVLNPWNIDGLLTIEKESESRIYNILQLRLHPDIITLKERIQNELLINSKKKYEIDLTYLTSRGHWYFTSWKGNISKSGGIATNIGIHFYDMLIWIFGNVMESYVHVNKGDTAAGYLKLEHAQVCWFLSINHEYIPDEIKKSGDRTYRSIEVEGQELEFSAGLTDLHTLSYQHILEGQGFGLEDARKSIQLVYDIRESSITEQDEHTHPFVTKILS